MMLKFYTKNLHTLNLFKKTLLNFLATEIFTNIEDLKEGNLIKYVNTYKLL